MLKKLFLFLLLVPLFVLPQSAEALLLLLNKRVVAVSTPEHFGWSPSFTITGAGLGGYSASYSAESDKPSGKECWIDNTNGNDTTGDGTEGTPYKTLSKGATETCIVYNIKTGEYWRDDSFAASFGPSTDVALIAADGAGTVKIGRIEDFVALSWSSEGSGAYSATRSNVRTVLDKTETGHATKTLVDGSTAVPIPMESVADLAAVQAHAGHAWAQVGSTLYVKTHDGRAPDASVLPVLIEENTEFVNDDVTFYCDGVEIWGDQPIFMDFGTSNTAKLVAQDCGFRYSGDFDNVYIDGVDEVRLVRLKSSHQLSSDDCINYDRNSVNPPDVNGLEVDVEAFDCGDGTNDNGSTTHDPNVYVIRINGDYGDNPGPGIVDSAGAQGVNYGSKSNDGYIGIQVGTSSAGTPAVQWNKDTQATGNSNTGRSRATGGLQFDLGGNDFQNSGSSANNYVDAVAYPELETILAVAPDSIIGLYVALDTSMYVDVLSGEIDDFYDLSFNKMNAARIRSGVRATYSASQINGVAGWATFDAAGDDDTAYQLSKAADIYGLSFIGQYGDGTDTVFSFFHCLLTGNSSDTPRIMGNDGNNALHASGDFADGFSRDGGAEDTSPLAMPLDFYDAVSDTGAVQSSTYTILGSNTHTDGRAWHGENMGMVIIRDRAWTAGEESAIREAAKALFSLD